MPRVVRHHPDPGLDQGLDVAQVGALLGIAERDRDAAPAGPRGPSDPVDVALGDVRQVVVDHVRDALDVDAARRDVGRHQHAASAGLEALERAGAGGLGLVAMDGVGRDPILGELPGDPVGAVLGPREDQGAADRGVRSTRPSSGRLWAFSTNITRCSTSSAVEATGSASTLTGSRRMLSARRTISGSMVAEKNKDWRRSGSAPITRGRRG